MVMSVGIKPYHNGGIAAAKPLTVPTSPQMTVFAVHDVEVRRRL
jgi:hypothetical protein